MYLSSIDLFGFKSFAQRTRINFAPGVTAIVGPNGCGKSNLVDAVRWVLGEQREAALRSERMENVIFGGTQKRRPLGMAEISLTLHDRHGKLPVEYEEVTVTRRLFRSGKSEYLLNKTVCRLKDLVDLFMDTGVGPDTYSIIELKMVEGIISEDPNELRRLLDQATGITRYKVRRKEALRRLVDARQDRERVFDVLAEVERQVNSLKRQVARVRAYKRYQEKAKRIRLAIVLARVHELEKQLGPLDDSLGKLQERIQKTSGDLGSAETEAMRAEQELLQLENQRQELSRQFNEAQSSYQSALQEKNRVEEEIRLNEWRREKNQEETERISAELKAAEQHILAANEVLEKSRSAQPALEERLKEKQAAFREEDEKFKRARAESIATGEKLNDLRARESSAIRASEGRRASIRTLKARLEDLEQRQSSIRADIDKKREELVQSEANLEELSGELQKLRSAKLKIETETEALREKIRSLEHERDQANAARDRVALQIEHFNELHRRSSPLYSGGSALASQFPEVISATLADELQVDAKYVRAVESSLQGMAFSRAVLGEESFETLLDYLRNKSVGRAALLLGKAPSFDLSSVRSFAEKTGGKPLADCIERSSTVSDWIRSFLRNTVLYQSIEEMQSLTAQAAQNSISLVTLAGEFTDGKGLWIVGTSADAPPKALGVSENLKELAGQLRIIENRLLGLQESIAEATAELATLASERDSFLRALKEKQLSLDRETGRKLQFEAQIASSNLLLEQLHREAAEIPATLEKLSSDEEAQKGELNSALEQMEELEKSLRLQQESEATALDRREGARQALAEAQIEFERAGAEVVRAQDRVSELEQRRRRLAEGLDALAGEKESFSVKERHLNEELELLKEKVTEAGAKVEELRYGLEGIDSTRRAKQEEQRSGGSQVRDLRSNMEEISRQIHQVQLEKVQIESSLKEERAKLEGIDLDEIKDEPADSGKLAELERKILSMEPLNLAAEREYEEQKKRLDFLSDQIRDLDEAEMSLEQTVKTLNKEAADKFDAGFERIRSNFREVFQQIFEGGEADFRLAEDDPLEAQIEILATPGNKKIGSLSLLSGGEKALTAIALLFAVYMEKPSPFCILDEVDAPLDDENTMRFCHLLEKLSPQTQFLVVTHNKRTMEVAENLLGVTMEEDGISKVVPVQLN